MALGVVTKEDLSEEVFELWCHGKDQLLVGGSN